MTTRTSSTVQVPSAPRRDMTRLFVFLACLGAGVGAVTAGLAGACASVAGALLSALGAA